MYILREIQMHKHWTPSWFIRLFYSSSNYIVPAFHIQISYFTMCCEPDVTCVCSGVCTTGKKSENDETHSLYRVSQYIFPPTFWREMRYTFILKYEIISAERLKSLCFYTNSNVNKCSSKINAQIPH
jgi:hypothetical protein